MDIGHGNRLGFAPHPRFSEIWLFLNSTPLILDKKKKNCKRVGLDFGDKVWSNFETKNLKI